MKRDMDLIRKILFAVEGHPSGFAPGNLEFDGYTEEQIDYHAYLLMDAGLVDAREVTHSGSPSPAAQIVKLTWEGHEFAELARNDAIWKKAVALVLKTAGSLTIATLQVALTKLATEAITGK